MTELISERALFALSTLVMLTTFACSGSTGSSTTADGGSQSSAGSTASGGGGVSSGGSANQAGSMSSAGTVANGGASGGTPSTGGSDSAGSSATGGDDAGGAGDCEASPWPANTPMKSKVVVGQYCDMWYVCFASKDEAQAAAAAHAQLDCSTRTVSGCAVPCLFQPQERALSAADYDQLCSASSASSADILCGHLE